MVSTVAGFVETRCQEENNKKYTKTSPAAFVAAADGTLKATKSCCRCSGCVLVFLLLLRGHDNEDPLRERKSTVRS